LKSKLIYSSIDQEEIIGKVPSWIIYKGLFIFLLSVIIFVISSLFIKVSDDFPAEIKIVSQQKPFFEVKPFGYFHDHELRIGDSLVFVKHNYESMRDTIYYLVSKPEIRLFFTTTETMFNNYKNGDSVRILLKLDNFYDLKLKIENKYISTESRIVYQLNTKSVPLNVIRLLAISPEKIAGKLIVDKVTLFNQIFSRFFKLKI